MERDDIEKQGLAALIGVSPGRVSQVLNNPGNLTVAQIVKYTRALGMKVAIIAYDDDDPTNKTGPISAEVFTRCWERAGFPRDLFMLDAPTPEPISKVRSQNFYRPILIVGPSKTYIQGIQEQERWIPPNPRVQQEAIRGN